MSRNLGLAAVAVIAVIIGGWWLVQSQLGQTPSTPATTTTETVTITPSPLSASPSSTTSEEQMVTISSTGFNPATVTIKAGGTVNWTNSDSADHTVNSAPHPTHQIFQPLNRVGLIKPAETKSFQFSTPGVYKYHDHLNPSLTGTVVVE